MKIRFLERKNDVGLLMLRIALSGMMLLHGINKLLHGIGGIKNMVVQQGMPSFLAYGVLIGEVLAPVCILLGFKTRLWSLILAFNCFIAWFLVHRHQLFSLNTNGGWAIELLGFYFFVSFALVFTGGGKYAASRKSIWD